MKIIAIICEYNPFHKGHALLFRRIRERFGEDSAIICILSDNFVQRGEPAVLSKWARAQATVCEGADLVLELPFPYSASSAERFARAGVAIANSLSCVDHLAFGSESGDTEHLLDIAKNMESEPFSSAYAQVDADKACGSAEKCAIAYEKAFGKEPALFTANNILGIEYIRALIRQKSTILPSAFLREGGAHDEVRHEEIGSAMAAREMLESGKTDLLFSLLPAQSASVLQDELTQGRVISSPAAYQNLLLLSYRLLSAEQYRGADGMQGGLADRIASAALTARTGEEFFELIRTKRYTDAFLRRTLLYGLFGVTRERLNAPPAYTQVLAFTKKGQKILASIRKNASIPILTKPADYKSLDDTAREAAELSFRANSIYSALLDKPSSPSDLLRHAPFRKV